MIDKLLQLAGFEYGKTYKELFFMKPPKTTYIVYLDSFESGGADYHNLIKWHSYSVEMYEYQRDKEAERALEKAFDDLGIEYSRQDALWLKDEQLYQVVYMFDYIEK